VGFTLKKVCIAHFISYTVDSWYGHFGVVAISLSKKRGPNDMVPTGEAANPAITSWESKCLTLFVLLNDVGALDSMSFHHETWIVLL